MKCPVSWPTTANRSWPSASISATRSAARVPVSYPAAGLSDRPMPRWSTVMTSKSRASAGITRRHAYQFSGQPCTSSSGGPSPPMTACRRTLPASMNRLLNVRLNPAGRCGGRGRRQRRRRALKPRVLAALAYASEGASPAASVAPASPANQRREIPCSASETDPGPSGVGRRVEDELMTDLPLGRPDGLWLVTAQACSSRLPVAPVWPLV
jgi:hypothetical protein